MSQAAALDLKAQSLAFEDASPEDILRWSVSHFGKKLCMQTSFQLGGMVLIDMLSRIDKTVPIFFIDTGFHFKETLEFRDKVVARYGINLITLTPLLDRELFKAIYGNDTLYERNPQECCRINKVEPMEHAVKDYAATVSALRRDSSAERSKIDIIDQRVDGIVRLHPIANWTREQTRAYLKQHDVPTHPLHDKGYKTIGCSPTCCTVPVGENAPERAGRWTGTGKSECGLHLINIKRPSQDFSI
ncbi:MAG TPA: phosphoadenylyl-sulfate reductase [Planctomycetota bacterium]|nr:phosphoadenylyl-sulfate reductase [Planctomycetota bacterium]